MRKRSGFVRAMGLVISFLTLASCSVLGASLDSLTSESEFEPGQVPDACVDDHCTPSPMGDSGATCAEGQTDCNGLCADVRTDAKNCGVCGKACGPDEECVAATCMIKCTTQLRQPVLKDLWGWFWDGRERAEASFADAEAECTRFRGRVPTASELFRVNANESATVGQSNDTNPLWSLAPDGPSSHVTVMLNDGTVSTDTHDTKHRYRCVCPPTLPTDYVGDNCNGADRTNGCATLAGEGQQHNIDTKDRPALPKEAASWECSFYGGHLATPVQLLEAIQQNVGPSSATLHSADEVTKDYGAVIGGADASINYAPMADKHAFRCVGENAASTPPPANAGRWSAPGGRSLDAADLPAATLVDAIDHCFESGGHLPTLAELHELIVQGAPAGSGSNVWTSDETDRDNVVVTRWTGTEPKHRYGGDAADSRSKKDSYAYRCVYYAIDPAYAGPPTNACEGGCMALASVAPSQSKSWFDSNDRSGAMLTEAVDACRKLGGHLASERDLVEAIRAGLPNGTDAYLHTGDSMNFRSCTTTNNNIGYCSIGGNLCGPVGALCNFIGLCVWNGSTTTTCEDYLAVGLVKWTGTKTKAFDNVSDKGSVGWASAAEKDSYRCTWTNELR